MANRIFMATSPTSVTKQVYPIDTASFGYTWERVKDSYRYTKKIKNKMTFMNNPKTGALDFDFFNTYEQNPTTQCQPLYINIYKVCGSIHTLEYKGVFALNNGDWNLDSCTVSITIDELVDDYSCINDNKGKDYPFGGLVAYEPGEFYYYGGPFPGKTQVFPQKLVIDNGTTIYTYEEMNPLGGDRGSVGFYDFQNACGSLIGYLLQDCGTPINGAKPALKSDFFDWWAPGDTPGYVPGTHTTASISAGINYATGGYNFLTHMMVMQKSDARKPNATQWATQQILYTFDKLQKLWANMFNCFWFIDVDGVMRVEHISYFTAGGAIYDTTVPPHAKWNVNKRKYNYNKDEIPRIEQFVFSDNVDIPNGGNVNSHTNNFDKIIYDSICVNQNPDNNTKQYQVDGVTTDVLIIGSAYEPALENVYSESGIVLLTCVFTSPPYGGIFIDGEVPKEAILADIDTTLRSNTYIQWANLIRRFLLDRRILKTGLNGPDLLTFTSNTQKSKSQQDIIYQLCCGEVFNPENATIITDLGAGIVDKADYDGNGDIIKLTVLHD